MRSPFEWSPFGGPTLGEVLFGGGCLSFAVAVLLIVGAATLLMRWTLCL